MARVITLNLQIKELIILKYRPGIKQASISQQLNLSRSVICKTIKLFRLRKSLITILMSLSGQLRVQTLTP
ncbi:unnamed protein product [Acanthoscelides obtectus]|uniref:Uncharacterized protein n=1 Tax=Acanthoscelides obtectus TaxID=200917 RepID=A0A9P0PY72_ACAOB|nr:unnamed protein product [Acanthoscelides obtectus]CAK1673367.1 hypothetical protein AOBTE_LOCUS29310 [Acanthoscelides obtectus]